MQARWRWISAREWDEIALRSPAATGFHTRGWMEAIADWDTRFRPRALGLELADGTRACLPLLLRSGPLRRGLFARAVSSHPNTWGGPLAETRVFTAEDWRVALAALARTPLGRIECFGNPLQPIPAESTVAQRGPRLATFVLPLLPGEPERARYSRGCKRALNKAERDGVQCARLGRAELADYEALYADSLARWGEARSSGYPPRLFAALLELPACELWGARLPSGELAAVGTFVFSRASCVYWHGSMRAALSDSFASNALQHRLICEARARGCASYDFNPSGGHAGVEHFKRSFGAEELRVTGWRHLHALVAHFARRGAAQ